MSPKPDVTEERTAQILDAATEVFVKKGLGKTRMDDIAKVAGVSKGTLYLYFESKETIIGALLNKLLQRELDSAERLIGDKASVEEKLNAFVDVAIADVKNMLPMTPLFFEFLAIMQRRGIAKKQMSAILHEFVKVIMPLIEQGVESGELRRVDPFAVTVAVAAIFEGAVMLWVYDPALIDLDVHIRSSMALLLNGLKNKES